MALTPWWQAVLERFHFERPLWLLVLPLLLALAVWLARRQSAAGSWTALVDAPLRDALRLPETTAPRGTPWPWLAGAWALAVLALAGPTWQREPAAAHAVPDAWVLVLDLSPSMGAADVAPQRSTRARYAIEDLLRAAHGARIGLVVFGDEAYTVTPLTDDIATVRGLARPLAPGLLPGEGDHLAPALSMAQQLLERISARGGHVVVLTDGSADLPAARTAAQALAQRGSPVDVLAIGAQQAAGTARTGPVAQTTPPSATAPSGDRLAPDAPPPAAPPDRAALQSLAQAGGGRLFELSDITTLTARLQAQASHNAQPLAGVEAARWRDAGVWLLPPLLLVAAVLARRGWW